MQPPIPDPPPRVPLGPRFRHLQYLTEYFTPILGQPSPINLVISSFSNNPNPNQHPHLHLRSSIFFLLVHHPPSHLLGTHYQRPQNQTVCYLSLGVVQSVTRSFIYTSTTSHHPSPNLPRVNYCFCASPCIYKHAVCFGRLIARQT